MSVDQIPFIVPVGTFGADDRPELATLIGADFSALSITPSRADSAPGVVRAAFERFGPWDAAHDVDLSSWRVTDLGDAGAMRMPWDEARVAIRALAARAWDLGSFVVGLGGDHSVSWPLIAAAAERGSRIGVIQLDIHHDVRPLDDGPSNGTPIRGLIESGIVSARDVVQIGIHPFANRRPLTEWCDEHEIHRYSRAQVRDMGAGAIARGTSQILLPCDLLYLTVDIDVLDRAHAPGTVAALPGGLHPTELFDLVAMICLDERVRGMDVVEFDPSHDVESITAWTCALTVLTALSSVARRRRTP